MSMMGNGGPSVLQEGATEEKGEHARLASFVGAMAISDLVKSTLGPKGMDKILMSMVRNLEFIPAPPTLPWKLSSCFFTVTILETTRQHARYFFFS